MDQDSLSIEDTNNNQETEPFKLNETDPLSKLLHINYIYDLDKPIEKSKTEPGSFLSQPFEEFSSYSHLQYKEALEKFITAIRNNDLEEA